MRRLKLLFTSKIYRWATLEGLKLKLISLPGISKYRAYKMLKKMKNMNRWEQYVALRNVSIQVKKIIQEYKIS